MPTKPKPTIAVITCPPDTFRDPEDPKRCIPITVLMGEEATIFQGPDCWPKQFTIRKPFDPAFEGMILGAIRREVKGATPETLSRDLAAAPRLQERVRAARPVRKPG